MIEICILYCLMKREMTIYSVRKHITEIFGAYTKPSHGTIHPALKKFSEKGFVQVSNILSEGGKKSCYYSVTEKGKKYFQDLMLSDFSENPSVFFNEMNIKIASMGRLNKENQIILKQKCIRYADLYVAQMQRTINNEYNELDIFQKAVMSLTIKNTKSLIKFLSESI